MRTCFICGSGSPCPHREPATSRRYPDRLGRTQAERNGRILVRKPAPWKIRRMEYLASVGRVIVFPDKKIPATLQVSGRPVTS